MFDYMESRGGEYPATVFFGLQYYLKEFFATPIEQWEVDEAYEDAQAHGVPFDIDGWNYIVQVLGGWLPVEIKAVREGTLVPVKNILVSIESTDKKVPWIAGWLETILMKVWYPTTVATKAYYVKQMLLKYGPVEWAQFAYHNFGDRGSSSVESAAIGGMAHLTQFMGTDNFNALRYTRAFYDEAMAGYSVFATEHSTTTSNLEEFEEDFVYEKLLQNPDRGIMSFVGDSYDIYRFTDFVTNKNMRIRQLMDSRSEQKFVIRPDSGKPTEVIPKMLDIMVANNVDYVEVEDGILFTGYGILWGDGVTPAMIEEIIRTALALGFSAMNFVFGSGGDIMQNVNRDTQKFAIKCSNISLDETNYSAESYSDNKEPERVIVSRDVWKDPITDPGKASKKGKMTLWKNNETGEVFTGPLDFTNQFSVSNMMRTVYKNGKLEVDYKFAEVRQNSNEA